MKRALLLLAVAGIVGCASLPDFEAVSRDAPGSRWTPTIVGADGALSPEAARAALARLQPEAGPTDILDRHLRIMEAVTGTPLTAGNKATLLLDRPGTYAAMSDAIAAATDHVNAEFFEFDDDRVGTDFANLLLEKQGEGVQVNLIYDSFGSLHTPPAFFQRLRDGGIHVLEFNPIDPLEVGEDWTPTNRDHRKILIVDGAVAFTGGTNISRVYSSTSLLQGADAGKEMAWRDANVRIEGPAVAEFQKLFLDTWERHGGEKVARRDYFPHLEAKGSDLVRVIGSRAGEDHRRTYLMYLSALHNAARSIHLTNAYFVPDHDTLEALEEASERGVDVRLVLPGASDSGLAFYAGRSHYSDLLEAGVRIFDRKDAILHAKTAVIDGVWATVGSTNLDLWSFSRNDEVNAAVLSPTFASQVEAMFDLDLGRSDRITDEQWAERGFKDRLKEWLARLMSYWL